MIIIYIKPNRFFKNVDPLGNIFDVVYPTRDVIVSQKEEILETITETYDNYIEDGYKKIELEDKYKDVEYEDFNDDLTFSIEKYNARKQKENKLNYKKEVERLVALRYDIYDELAIQRQKEEKPEEYKEYYEYVEQCKQEAKNAINQEQIEESVSEEREDGNESGQEQTTSVSDCLLSKEEIGMIINDESL